LFNRRSIERPYGRATCTRGTIYRRFSHSTR
jgi:hypothetical protein